MPNSSALAGKLQQSRNGELRESFNNQKPVGLGELRDEDKAAIGKHGDIACGGLSKKLTLPWPMVRHSGPGDLGLCSLLGGLAPSFLV